MEGSPAAASYSKVHIAVAPQNGRGDLVGAAKIADYFIEQQLEVVISTYTECIDFFQSHSYQVMDVDKLRPKSKSEKKDLSEEIGSFLEQAQQFVLQITYPTHTGLDWLFANGIPTLDLHEYNQKCQSKKNPVWVTSLVLGLPNNSVAPGNGLLFDRSCDGNVKSMSNLFVAYANQDTSMTTFLDCVCQAQKGKPIYLVMPNASSDTFKDFELKPPYTSLSVIKGSKSNKLFKTEGIDIVIDAREWDRKYMLKLWQRSEPLCMCTGDQSWSEAVQFGKRFLYEALGHKTSLAKSIEVLYGDVIIKLDYDIENLPCNSHYQAVSKHLVGEWNAMPRIFEASKKLLRAHIRNWIGSAVDIGSCFPLHAVLLSNEVDSLKQKVEQQHSAILTDHSISVDGTPITTLVSIDKDTAPQFDEECSPSLYKKLDLYNNMPPIECKR